MRQIIGFVVLAVIGAFFFLVVVGLLANPQNWITPEQKKCEEMGGLFIQNSFSKDCIFNPHRTK